jgi:hypothetical protein
VGAEADELEGLRVRLAVDEDEVGLDVAVAVVLPVAGEHVVAVAGREGEVALGHGAPATSA